MFYVRIAPCAIDAAPDYLTLRHLRDELGVSLEINGNRVPASETASSTLRKDRVDRESSEVTYVSTDNVKISGGVEFEPKLGISSPSIEVYVAGRWSDTPVILTKMINFSPRRKSPRYSTLDAIPEVSDETEKDQKIVAVNGLIHRKLQITESEDEYEAEGKLMHNWYPDESRVFLAMVCVVLVDVSAAGWVLGLVAAGFLGYCSCGFAVVLC
uniref:Uncharacterized protein n=1 Tax=Chenopodium quinoa TaxID=63459 RepID=A0A803M314_CHEQI